MIQMLSRKVCTARSKLASLLYILAVLCLWMFCLYPLYLFDLFNSGEQGWSLVNKYPYLPLSR